MNTITIEIRWRVPVENQRKRTQEFFDNYQSIETDINIKEIFSFGHPNNKQPFVDIYINDRDGKNAYWAKKLIDALKKENDIASTHLISDTELMDMVEKELIEIDEERTLKSNPRKYIYIIKQ